MQSVFIQPNNVSWLTHGVTVFSILLFLGVGCNQTITSPKPYSVNFPALQSTRSSNMFVTSSAFKSNENIPSRYTCDGEDISPPLAWGDVPEGVESFVLIVDDPDAPAGTWTHWTVWNIPASVREILENVRPEVIKTMGAVEGVTSFGKTGWGGPCPPSGVHRYFFKLYALDTTLSLSPQTSVQELARALDGHVVASVQMIGKYQRSLK